MRINIQTKNLDLSPAIKDYVEEKVTSFSKLLGQEVNPLIDIELAKEKTNQNSGEDLYKAEINMDALGNRVFVDAHAFDLYAAIDEVKDKVLRELRQEKEKESDRGRAGARELKSMLRNENE